MKNTLTKLEAAPDGSQELDWLISKHFGEIPEHTIREIGWDYEWYRKACEFSLRRINDAGGGSVETWYPPYYTTSVDAAIALARREWTDVMYRVGNDGEGADPSLFLGEIFIPGEYKDAYFTGVSTSPALALCIAILKAKEASHERT